MDESKRKPEWLKIKLEAGGEYPKVKKIVELNQLHTICSSGKCPNIGKCWNMGTATFMILGDICTRSCKFCATKSGKPLAPDLEESVKIAKSVQLMKLKHCVITSVDRDDLDDKGAALWAATIKETRALNPTTVIEVLTPDFDNVDTYLDVVFEACPDIFSHNLETVERLSNQVRSRAKYDLSLDVLRKSAARGLITKTGIMVGLGETESEVVKVLEDAYRAGCSMFTIGQYLQPTKNNLDVVQYVKPEQFEKYKQIGTEIGYQNIESAPLVRSSYMAERSFIASKLKK